MLTPAAARRTGLRERSAELRLPALRRRAAGRPAGGSAPHAVARYGARRRAAGRAQPPCAQREMPGRERRAPHVMERPRPPVRLPQGPCRRVGFTDAGWSSSVARWAHNPEVAGSNPVPATRRKVPRPRAGGPSLSSPRPRGSGRTDGAVHAAASEGSPLRPFKECANHGDHGLAPLPCRVTQRAPREYGVSAPLLARYRVAIVRTLENTHVPAEVRSTPPGEHWHRPTIMWRGALTQGEQQADHHRP